jgi:hypothetical protein
MKRAAAIVGLAYLWTIIASALFCAFNFSLFTFPFLQWWEGLYYLRNMLWLPRLRDFIHWPLLWFVDGFVLASLVIFALSRPMLGSLWPRKDRQPNLYGTSKFAGVKAMAEGGITTEKRR